MPGALHVHWDRNAESLRWTRCLWCEHGETTGGYEPGGSPDNYADAMRDMLTAHQTRYGCDCGQDLRGQFRS